MNAIEKDFRSEMDQLETEELDSKLPKILAGKVERFIEWKDFGQNPFVEWIDTDDNGELIKYYTDEITSKKWTLSDLYQYFIDNVEGK